MTLTSNSETNKTASSLVKTLQGAFSTPPGLRPAHARGILLTGTYTPSTGAADLTSAQHLTSSTPLTIRFSNSTGIPTIPDNDPQAAPHGMAIRFHLPNTADGKRAHTDIVAHSTAFFPVRTGALFLEMLGAIGGGTIGDFLAKHPSALAFVQDPKPAPESFATEKYFGVNAYKFVNAEGKETFVRYRITPVAGEKHLSEEEAKSRDTAYLHNEIQTRVVDGPVEFKFGVQVAEEGDVVDDCTVHWAEERKIVEIGSIKVEGVVGEGNDEEQRKIIFDPVPRGVKGVETSGDPLLDMRADVYLMSGRERREAAKA